MGFLTERNHRLVYNNYQDEIMGRGLVYTDDSSSSNRGGGRAAEQTMNNNCPETSCSTRCCNCSCSSNVSRSDSSITSRRHRNSSSHQTTVANFGLQSQISSIQRRRLAVPFSFSFLFFIFLVLHHGTTLAHCSIVDDKPNLKKVVVEMFDHAFNSYMNHAHPADELMPLTCTGRIRGITKSRGDIDDALGNFSLTLVDTLDTLFVMGKMKEFENAIRLVISNVRFDSNVVVSVFETNIRMLGGLLSGHVLAKHAQQSGLGLTWYSDELLKKAEDLGQRLLVAYSTPTGLPHPRVNLLHGLKGVPEERTTCTACAGSVLLEMGALSRLTGNPIYEEKARKAMYALWDRRNRFTNLVGSIMNVDTGEWVRSDSSVGAGSDSYYEYLLKSYILLGDVESYHRFSQHYESIMRYQLREGFLVDVPMHSPHSSSSRNIVDALSAFWPGLQTLIGDLAPAVRSHELLYALVRKYRFLPEAVTLSDYRTHWAHHPLRPEFVESTYFLYKATKDPYYLEVGRDVLNVLNATCRVTCGFAAIHDVNKMTLSDQMDSYLLAETFKYLYLLFSDPNDLPFKVDDFVFTTEGHLLPLYLSTASSRSSGSSGSANMHEQEPAAPSYRFPQFSSSETHILYSRVNSTTCPNHVLLLNEDLAEWAAKIRAQVRVAYPVLGSIMGTSGLSPAFSRAFSSEQQQQQHKHPGAPDKPSATTVKPLMRAVDFNADNAEHLAIVRRMGLILIVNADGRAQLWHRPETAESPDLGQAGLIFMRDMVLLQAQAERQQQSCPADAAAGGNIGGVQYRPVQVWLLSHPYCGNFTFHAGPSQFGLKLESSEEIVAPLARTHADDGCVAVVEPHKPLVDGAIAIARRGGCTFAEKARASQALGAVALIVVDSEVGTSQEHTPFFALSADIADDINIPVAFLFHREGEQLLSILDRHVESSNDDGDVMVMLWRQPENRTEELAKLQRSWPAICDETQNSVDAEQDNNNNNSNNYDEDLTQP